MTKRCNVCGEFPGVEFLHKWMRTANPMLGNWTPLQMMEGGRGQKLAQFIIATEAENRCADESKP